MKRRLIRLLSAVITILLLFDSVKAEDLTVEEKIGQILIPYIDCETADFATYTFLRSYRPGGIILFNWANGLHSQEQVKSLCLGLQDQAEKLKLPPLFIAVDQEGGLIARLHNGFTEFPGNGALGRTDSKELAFTSAKEMGHEMLQVGVNFVCAPVVDINSNANNPVIGIRSYGDHSELVTRLGLAASLGFSDAGVISCLKHFPGHGDVDVDSHTSLPILNKSKEDLDKLELVPFRSILNISPAIMTAHLRIPNLDSHCCVTLSKKILTNLLRNEWGYQGLIITDSLTMGGVLAECQNIGEAAVRAFEAGADLLLIGEPSDKSKSSSCYDDLMCVQQSLLKAVHEGRITPQRIEESLHRILDAKKNFHVGERIVMKGNRRLAEECSCKIAKRAIRLEKGVCVPQLWNKKRVAIVAPRLLEEAIIASELVQVGFSSQVFYFEDLEPKSEEIRNLEGQMEQVDAIIFLSYNAWRFAKQESLLRNLSQKHPLILIATRDSQDAKLENLAQTIISTVSPTAIALRAVVDCLLGKVGFKRESLSN